MNSDPQCAWCSPCRPEDIDPSTAIFHCELHRARYDELMARLTDLIMIPAHARDTPIRFPRR